MSVNIICHKSQGLLNDLLILKRKLKEKYKVYEIVCEERDIYNIKNDKKVDKQFFLEHICPNLLQNSECNIYIPNLEFINKNDLKLMKTKYINHVIAKTQHSYEMLSSLLDNKVFKWNWTSIDRKISRINPDFNQYLHIKGKSKYKNSQLILQIWLRHPEWPMLHIAHNGDINKNGFLEINHPLLIKDNITLYQYELDKTTLESLMNRCGNHICPSETEGYGHYINEARSVGAVIITTNAAPMNEFITKNYGFSVTPREYKTNGLGTYFKIDECDLEKTIQNCIDTSWESKFVQSDLGKELFKQNDKLFHNQII